MYVPPGSWFVVPAITPPLPSVNSATPVWFVSEPEGPIAAIKATSPVGVVLFDVTFPPTATEAPCVMVIGVETPFSVSVVLVALKIALLHAVTKFATLTEPRPVAMSYPAAAAYTPLGYPVSPGTELFPLVTSLNTHALLGAAEVLEALQLVPAVCCASASVYRT